MNNKVVAARAMHDLERTAIETLEEITIDGVTYRRHSCGGGLVALTAFVTPRVRISPKAMVRDRAVVIGSVRLFDEAIIEENAVVVGACTLRDRARVGGHAVLRDNVTLADAARADGLVTLAGSVKLRHFAHISTGSYTGGMTIT
ncbi:hypothetical protein [uncultured Microbacterium sp.]|uniref:hypothetical protein n=1 Tax=uncultured Microbacterium sp. TaxID=191216 RepID=UPI0035CBD539